MMWKGALKVDFSHFLLMPQFFNCILLSINLYNAVLEGLVALFFYFLGVCLVVAMWLFLLVPWVLQFVMWYFLIILTIFASV